MPLEITGFTNASAILQGGVYMLVRKGEIVYIGKAKRMLNRLSAHLSVWAAKKKERIPSFLPLKGIYYDEVLICPVHPDRIDAEERRLIDIYRPRYNTQLKTSGPISSEITLLVSGYELKLNKEPSEPIRRRA